VVFCQWYIYCNSVSCILKDNKFHLHDSVWLFVSPFHYPSCLAPTFILILYNSLCSFRMFRSLIFQHSYTLFVRFPVPSIHDSQSILDYTRALVHVAVLLYLRFAFLGTFPHYISPVSLSTSRWLIDLRSSRRFISHVASILIAKLNAYTCGSLPRLQSYVCVCVCVCVCVRVWLC
jgi:hypothetical protein